jgi:AmmeMemoRadiSam system protein A
MTATSLSEATRRDLLALARRSIESSFRGEPEPRLGSDRAETFGEPRALFVTLRKGGDLRGCIGTLAPNGDLGRTVPSFARRAAFEDPRFPPLSEAELLLCDIEISVLTPPTAVTDPSEIEVGRDGLILDARGYSGLLLPQVATEWGFDRERFLEELSLKAGLPRDGWKSPDARIWRFQAEVFGEESSTNDQRPRTKD